MHLPDPRSVVRRSHWSEPIGCDALDDSRRAFSDRIGPVLHRVASSLRRLLISRFPLYHLVHAVVSRVVVVLRGPGRVHIRQTRHESTMAQTALIASSGAPACLSNSDNRFAGACQKRTCSLRRVRRMTAGSRECNSFSACPRSNAVHSCVSVSSPVSVGPGTRAELCRSRFARTRSLVCSSAALR